MLGACVRPDNDLSNADELRQHDLAWRQHVLRSLLPTATERSSHVRHHTWPAAVATAPQVGQPRGADDEVLPQTSPAAVATALQLRLQPLLPVTTPRGRIARPGVDFGLLPGSGGGGGRRSPSRDQRGAGGSGNGDVSSCASSTSSADSSGSSTSGLSHSSSRDATAPQALQQRRERPARLPPLPSAPAAPVRSMTDLPLMTAVKKR